MTYQQILDLFRRYFKRVIPYGFWGKDSVLCFYSKEMHVCTVDLKAK